MEENVRSMMELLQQDYLSIMLMPYGFFIETLKWKIKLEEEKTKQIEEKTKGKTRKTSSGLTSLQNRLKIGRRR